MNFLEVLGICFLVQVTLVLTITSWTLIAASIGKKATKEREKIIDQMTSNIMKQKSISDQDEKMIDNAIAKVHGESDNQILREIYNSEKTPEDLEKEQRKQEFLKQLESAKQKFDKED